MKTLTAVIFAILTVGGIAAPRISPPPGHGILYGSDRGVMPSLQAETSGITAERVYLKPGVPQTWPTLVPPGLVPVLSFKPGLIGVISGKDDTALLSFLRGAPSGSWVTLWHEGNLPGNHLDRAAYRAATAHLLTLARGLPVKVGQIFGDSATACGWVVPGMDFYGFDGYQRKTTQTPASIFGPNLGCVRQAAGANAPVALTETNTLFSTDQWARASFAYWRAQNALSFLWFADPGQPFIKLPSATVAASIARAAPQS